MLLYNRDIYKYELDFNQSSKGIMIQNIILTKKTFHTLSNNINIFIINYRKPDLLDDYLVVTGVVVIVLENVVVCDSVSVTVIIVDWAITYGN